MIYVNAHRLTSDDCCANVSSPPGSLPPASQRLCLPLLPRFLHPSRQNSPPPPPWGSCLSTFPSVSPSPSPRIPGSLLEPEPLLTTLSAKVTMQLLHYVPQQPTSHGIYHHVNIYLKKTSLRRRQGKNILCVPAVLAPTRVASDLSKF